MRFQLIQIAAILVAAEIGVSALPWLVERAYAEPNANLIANYGKRGAAGAGAAAPSGVEAAAAAAPTGVEAEAAAAASGGPAAAAAEVAPDAPFNNATAVDAGPAAAEAPAEEAPAEVEAQEIPAEEAEAEAEAPEEPREGDGNGGGDDVNLIVIN